jgi:4-oxalocrotonate tautomerase
MPIIRVELLEGRTVEQKREFAEVVTREGARILRCTPEAINVVFAPVARDDWAVAGKLTSDSK